MAPWVYMGVTLRPENCLITFCKYLTTEVGVAAVPFSAFYQNGLESGVNHFVRFCFCKQDDILDKAIKRLRKQFVG